LQEAGPSASTLIDLLRRRDATEASGLGAAGATILAAINRRLSLDVVRQVARETMLTTAFIFGLFVGANAFALVLRGPRR
jgi:TRAP-type mannitol/chloroaromatic compound transport system permease large subunit